MMVRRLATVVPPPRPSAVSARPSSWKAPVINTPAAMASRAGSQPLQTSEALQNTAAQPPPTSRPTSGK